MNYITTVGDLVKALSAYDQTLELEFLLDNDRIFGLNTDMSIYSLNDNLLVISLSEEL